MRVPTPRSSPALGVAVVALVALGGPPCARAYERELSLGAEIGFADARGPDLAGIIGGLHASYGIDDTWTVAALLEYSFHPDSEPLHVANASAELLYVFDVVRIVPYVGLGLGYYATVRSGGFGGEGGAHVALGAHYYFSRSVALGLDVRGHSVFTTLMDKGTDDFPLYTTVTLRLSILQTL